MGEIAEPSERQDVMHEVADFRMTCINRGEKMFVMPDRIGADALFIDKGSRRIHMGDFREPCHRQAKKRTHSIFDHQTRIDRGWQIAEDAKIERWRRDHCEILRIGKERPTLFERGGNDLGTTENMNGHGGTTPTRAPRIPACWLESLRKLRNECAVLKLIFRGLLIALALGLASCAHKDRDHLVRISVPDQKMLVFEKGVEIARYDVSTSKFGVGDRPGSFATPVGTMEVAQKFGAGQPTGMKFHSRRPTGEIVKPNTPGRDPIVSRILWLRGLEGQNRSAFKRAIYIHGTAEEWTIGTPASYGCIRMRSRDVIRLFDKLEVGARVEVTTNHFPHQLVEGNAAAATATVIHGTMPTTAPTPKPTPAVTAPSRRG